MLGGLFVLTICVVSVQRDPSVNTCSEYMYSFVLLFIKSEVTLV